MVRSQTSRKSKMGLSPALATVACLQQDLARIIEKPTDQSHTGRSWVGLVEYLKTYDNFADRSTALRDQEEFFRRCS